jgi:adenine deaminase
MEKVNNIVVKGKIVDVVNRRIFNGEVVVQNKVIIEIRKTDVEETVFILPGFIDSHVHIESSMLIPSQFAKMAIRHGTVAVVSDPHEIGNVLGIDGVEFMIDDGKNALLKFYFGAPSCVPATGFETSGSIIGIDDIEKLLSRKDIYFLSEMMNYPGVLMNNKDVLEKILISQKFNKPIDGHAPGLMGESLLKYISAGISTDHESYSEQEAIDKITNGMKVLIRDGSAAKNFSALHKLIELYPDSIMFCTDDFHPDDLQKGHINNFVKRSIALGYDLFSVLQIASLNPIAHYKLDVGKLQVGDPADFIVVDSLTDFNILNTFINGKTVYDGNSVLLENSDIVKINKFNCISLKLSDLEVPALSFKINVIEAFDGDLITKKIVTNAKIENGHIVSDTENDILKIVVYNRYFPEKKPALGFIKNFGLKKGAIVSSIAHDSHNIIAVGTNDNDLLTGINLIIESKGGIASVENDNIDLLPLEIGGLMTAENCDLVAEKYTAINKKVADLGSSLRAPFMTLSFMALLVIPEFKIGDMGLFDGNKFDFISLYV